MSIIPAPLPNSESSTTHSPTRVALVTGAAQGIGRGIALRLASDGFDVALNDILAKRDALGDVVREIEALGDGRRAIVVTGDVALEADVERAVEETVKQLGSLDVVCVSLLSVPSFNMIPGDECGLNPPFLFVDGRKCWRSSCGFNYRRFAFLHLPVSYIKMACSSQSPLRILISSLVSTFVAYSSAINMLRDK